MSARCAFIQAHRGEHPIRRLCQVLGVSRAGYYAWHARQHQGPGPRATADGALAATIQRVHRASQARYGSPRIHAELRAAGVRCSRKRVARLMREQQLAGKRRRRFRGGTTDARHADPVGPNRISPASSAWPRSVRPIGSGPRTTPSCPPGRAFSTSAVVLDLYSRRVVGWAMRHTQDHRLVLDALAMAVGQRQPRPGLVHHSDRGRQYASTAYQAELARRGMLRHEPGRATAGTTRWSRASSPPSRPSWSRGPTGAPARRRVRPSSVSRGVVHRQRRHSTLGYRSPRPNSEHRQPSAA